MQIPHFTRSLGFQFAVFIVSVLLDVVYGSRDVHNWPWTGMREPRLQQVVHGRRAELRCAGRVEGSPARWDYKECGSGENQTTCSDVIRKERDGSTGHGWRWRRLLHNRSSFVIVNATEKNSGLYRCREAATERINVYSTVELEVLKCGDQGDTSLPQFLDFLPKNVTAFVEGQVVFQCKVSSKTKPTIVWLVEGRGSFRYHNQLYELVNSTGEMTLPGGVYVSKMIISEAQEKHEGRYYCVAINTKGFSNNSAFLTVLPIPGRVDHGYSSFYWLFWMPVALATIPLLLWTVYLCSRRKSSGKRCENRSLCPECANEWTRNGEMSRLHIELMNLGRSRTIPEDEIM